MTTIKEIAERSGVAIGTVDRVLHDRGRVSPETAERVRRIANELGFKPNQFARNLSTSRAWRVGLLMPRPDQDAGYWRLPLSGAESAAKALQAYRIGLEPSFFDRYDPESFRAAYARLSDVDAVLMAPVLGLEAAAAIEANRETPHVAFDTEIEHPAVRCVIHQDSYRSGRLAGRLARLALGGEGNVAVLAPDADNYHIAERIRGIADELGGAVRVARHPHADEPGGYARALRGALPGGTGPRALVVADATTGTAARALRGTDAAGTRLIGFDLMEEDAPFLESGEISFLIAQAPRRQGELGLRQIFRLLVLNEACEREIRVPIDVITRENYPEHLGA